MKKLIALIVILFVADLAFGQIRNTRRSKQNDQEINYSNPKEYEIAKITIQGTELLDKNALISLSGLKVGDKVKIPGDDISGSIKKLWKHGLIGDATILLEKIEGDQVYLIIKLDERPRLSKFKFEGITKTQESDLSENIKLIRGKILTDADIKNIEFTVLGYFKEKGFLNAEIDITQHLDTLVSNGIQLTLKVDKKGKVKINEIAFEGNEEFKASKLRKKMSSTHEKTRFTVFNVLIGRAFDIRLSNIRDYTDTTNLITGADLERFINDNVKLNIFNSSKYKADEFEADKDLIIQYYNTKGYRDASIASDTMYHYDENTINIEIVVNEGKRYYFRNIDWVGNYVHTDKTLNAILGVSKGEIYDLERINRSLTFNPTGPDISGLYMDDGYLFFNVQPVEVRITEDSIDLEMRVFEGTQATINKIIIRGNDRTNDHVVLRELTTLPGQKFRRSDIIRTNQRLAQLGYFDPEQIGINPIPNPANGTVDIEYTLVEKPSDQVELSGGWGGSFGFVGTLGLSFNNFSLRNIPHIEKWRPLPIGDGQRLQLRAQANGRQFQSYTFAFSEPWLGGRKPNSFSISYNQSIQRTWNPFDTEGSATLTRTSQNDFNARLTLKSITLGLGRQLEWPDNYFTLTNSVSYTRYVLDNWTPGSLGFTDGESNNLTFNTTLARNSIDNPMFPRSGSTISLQISLTPPYSLWNDVDYQNDPNEVKFKWVEYHKWMLDAKYYLNILGNLVMETRVHFGFIGSYTSKSEIGPFERFQLGGDGLAGQNFILGTDIIGMRGYENNSITPPYDQGTNIDGVEGGIVYNKFSMELRYPVTTGAAATIYVYGFGEAGNNWNNYEEFNPFNSFRSAGLGARIFMPAFGLIGINWGWGFDTLPGQIEPSGAQFQFTIGQQLR